MKKNKTEIDYYGDEVSYIHLKFGDARKMFNFTKDFKEKYPAFCEEYENYWYDKNSYFKSAYSIIKYIEDYKIPVTLYLNFSDEVVNTERALEWWTNNNTIEDDLELKK